MVLNIRVHTVSRNKYMMTPIRFFKQHLVLDGKVAQQSSMTLEGALNFVFYLTVLLIAGSESRRQDFDM